MSDAMNLEKMIDDTWDQFKQLAKPEIELELTDLAENGKFSEKYVAKKDDLTKAKDDIILKKSIVYEAFFGKKAIGKDAEHLVYNVERLYFSGRHGQELLAEIDKAVKRGDSVGLAFYLQQADGAYELNVKLSNLQSQMQADDKLKEGIYQKFAAELKMSPLKVAEDFTGAFYKLRTISKDLSK